VAGRKFRRDYTRRPSAVTIFLLAVSARVGIVWETVPGPSSQRELQSTWEVVMRKTITTALATLAVVGLLAAGAVKAADPDKSEEVVKVTAEAGKPNADGTVPLKITIDIDPDWHTYANPVKNDTFELSKTRVTVGGVKDDDIKFTYPAGKVVKDKDGDYNVYEGTVTINAVVPASKADKLTVKVKVAACSDSKKRCLPASTIPVEVKLP
jgi:DsbC/DsbD-like thiol-disulfide interchange protein